MTSPLANPVLLHLGPVPITDAVIVTWVIMLVLSLGSFLLTRRLSLRPSATQAALELIVTAVDSQITDTMRMEPAPYRAFIGTLFVFIFAANWSTLIPGVEPPTAHLETDAALALLVFLAVIWFGIRAGGLRGYLASFAAPNPVMIPLNFVESLTRTFSLLVRLFGNVMSGVFHRHRALARRATRADPADGAGSADRRRAGLHLRRAGHGVHRPGHRRGEIRDRRRKDCQMNWLALASIVSAALAVSFGAIGPALGEGRAVAAAMDAIARQPEAANTISRTLFVGLAMIETMAIYCLVIALLLLFANPLLK